jgi:hypothetical protein
LISARAIINRRFMPPGEGIDPRIPLLFQLNKSDQPLCPLLRLLARNAIIAGVNKQIFTDRNIWVEVVLLRNDADPTTNRSRFVTDVEPDDAERAGR